MAQMNQQIAEMVHFECTAWHHKFHRNITQNALAPGRYG